MLAQRLHLQGLVAQMEAYWAAKVGGLNDLVRCVHAAVKALSCCARAIYIFPSQCLLTLHNLSLRPFSTCRYALPALCLPATIRQPCPPPLRSTPCRPGADDLVNMLTGGQTSFFCITSWWCCHPGQLYPALRLAGVFVLSDFEHEQLVGNPSSPAASLPVSFEPHEPDCVSLSTGCRALQKPPPCCCSCRTPLPCPTRTTRQLRLVAAQPSVAAPEAAPLHVGNYALATLHSMRHQMLSFRRRIQGVINFLSYNLPVTAPAKPSCNYLWAAAVWPVLAAPQSFAPFRMRLYGIAYSRCRQRWQEEPRQRPGRPSGRSPLASAHGGAGFGRQAAHGSVGARALRRPLPHPGGEGHARGPDGHAQATGK